MNTKKTNNKINQNNEIDTMFLAIKEARAELGNMKSDLDHSEEMPQVTNILDKLIAPDKNTSPKLAQTEYLNVHELEKKIPTSSKIFPSKKSLFISIAGTAIFGFIVGTKIGLSIYYADVPAGTKVTLIDMVKVLF